MNFCYDILINMDENNALEFYEWNDKDNIEKLKKTPLFRVTTKTIKDILKYKVKFNQELLNLIYQKTNIENKTIDYLMVLTDTTNVVVVELNTNGYVICLSKTLLNDEINLIELASILKLTNLKYEKIIKRTINYELKKEQDIKKILLCEINTLNNEQRYDKLKYLYYEWSNKIVDNNLEIFNNLKKLISNKFTLKHEYIYNLIMLSYQKK